MAELTGPSPEWYFHGNVWAEMRKSVSYRVDIFINQYIAITEAQCECGAGQGPTAHCKHIAAVLYSLTSIRLSRKIYFEETCTQVRHDSVKMM